MGCLAFDPMHCPQCGPTNREGRKVCGESGSPLPTGRPAYGLTNDPADKFRGGGIVPLPRWLVCPTQPWQTDFTYLMEWAPGAGQLD